MTLSEKDIKTLNAISLADVMSAWGYSARAVSKQGTWAQYLCPWHDDHNPSLVVDLVPRGTNADCGFLCMTCKQGGFGAIQLAARLMSKPAGELNGKEFMEVANELAVRCGVELEGYDPASKDAHVVYKSFADFKAANPEYADWDCREAVYEQAPWTVETLKALGFKVVLAQRKVRKADLGGQTAEHSDAGGAKNAEYTGAAGEAAAVIKVGDLLTEFDPDTGEALYRCSYGKDFYRNPNKAETRTIGEWGAELTRRFGVVPVKRFICRHEPQQGGACACVIRSVTSYPVFVFRYSFGIKKYEPATHITRYKWTWWNLAEDADMDHRCVGDADLEDVLAGDGVIPTQDKRHPFVATEKDKDGNPLKVRFERVVLCSGPRDAMQVWAHSNAHVCYLLSENAGFDQKSGQMRPNRWLRALLKKLSDITVEGGLYVCYDEDAVGLQCSKAIALANPQVRWLRLPRELGQLPAGKPQGTLPAGQTGGHTKPLKDVTDFITHFSQVEALMPADLQHDDPVEWFENALFDTPSCQFWQWESERKDADGTGRPRYKFDLRNVPVFLRARGMVRKVVQQGSELFSRFFLIGNDNTYTELFAGEKGGPNKLVAMARDLMAEWLRAHKQYNDDKGSLSRAIYSAKLEQGALETIEQADVNDKSFGPDFDHFFFENCAVRVTKDEVKTVSYGSMKWLTNRDAILEGKFSPVAQPWRIILNPKFEEERQRHENILADLHTPEERQQENSRWDQWVGQWKYRLIMDRPLDEMPMHFRFLYNTCRILWEKEETGTELTAAERQMQDMYFIAAAHAIGSALVRHRSANRQQFIHITDNGTRREDLASGGTGKTAILELLGLMRRVLGIDGKSLEGGNIVLEQELGKVVPGLHNIVALDELPDRFSPKKMYNYPLSLTSRGLYKGSVVLKGDDLPKFVVASNEQLDLSSDSTSRRIYQLLVSDYYHPRSLDGSRLEHTPADDFFEKFGVKEVARNLPLQLLNEARNLMIAFTQFFLQFPDETIRPPKDNRALLRQALAASKDEQFTKWIAGYLGEKRHRGIPIAQRTLAESLLDYCGQMACKRTVDKACSRIREQLPEYIKVSPYVMNPNIVLTTDNDVRSKMRTTAAWVHNYDANGNIPTDAEGNRVPREKKHVPCYYFYHRAHVPKKRYDKDHIGDPNYVQPAPDKDPDAE